MCLILDSFDSNGTLLLRENEKKLFVKCKITGYFEPIARMLCKRMITGWDDNGDLIVSLGDLFLYLSKDTLSIEKVSFPRIDKYSERETLSIDIVSDINELIEVGEVEEFNVCNKRVIYISSLDLIVFSEDDRILTGYLVRGGIQGVTEGNGKIKVTLRGTLSYYDKSSADMDTIRAIHGKNFTLTESKFFYTVESEGDSYYLDGRTLERLNV